MKSFQTVIAALILVLSSFAIVFADWQSTLESNFDIVDTFDQHGSWEGTGYGDVYGEVPSGSIWNYYSFWATAGSATNWIGPHTGYEWQADSPNNLKIAYDGTAASRFGLYFGDVNNPSSTSGYTDMYLFYMVYIPANAYPTSTENGLGTWSYVDGDGAAYTSYYKFNTFNKGCTQSDSDCGLYDDGRNYSDYHIVPQMSIYGWDGNDGSAPGLRYQTTDSGTYSFFYPEATGSMLPMGEWIGYEVRLRNYDDNGTSKVQIQSWYYDSDGTSHLMIDGVDTDGSQPASDAWNSFFFGGNLSGSPDATMDVVHYVDDFIINDSRVGPTYFALITGDDNTDTVIEPPGNLSAD